jgi:hypothetical protein
MRKSNLPVGPITCSVVGLLLAVMFAGERMMRGEPIQYYWILPFLALAFGAYWAILLLIRGGQGSVNQLIPRNAEEAQQAIMRLTSKQKQLLTFIAVRRPVYREVEAWARNNSISESELHFRLESLALRGLYGRKSEGYQERRLVVASACEQYLRGEFMEDRQVQGANRNQEEEADNRTSFGDDRAQFQRA